MFLKEIFVFALIIFNSLVDTAREERHKVNKMNKRIYKKC